MLTKSIVIIPTYNEKENISDIIHKVFTLDIPFHILVVDDNSPDGTASIVKKIMQDEFPDRLHILEREGKQGLGTAYIAGFKWCLEKEYDFIFEMDADFSHNPEDLVKLHHACAVENNDMSVGSRYISGANVVNWPLGRVLLSYYASRYVGIVTGLPIKDTTAGFVCYSAEVLRTIELDHVKFKGYAFQIEMKFLTWLYGFTIKEVPIIFTDRTRGVSKMNKSIIKEAFFGVLQMKFSSLFRKFERK
ncbi:polyprenol monophosphomannose synthase [Bacteroidota bacterium]